MNATALTDGLGNPRCAYPRKPKVSDHYVLPLVVCGLFLVAATAAKADIELPAVTVTGKTPPTARPLDTVGRDWAERSPEVNWPTPMFNGAAEVFAHNQIVINASCQTVWDHLIHAELWPHWCPYSGKVAIWGRAQVLQKNSKFTWVSSDLPQNIGIFETYRPDRVDAQVMEFAPPNRIGWRSFGRQWTIHGPLVDSYHNWFIKPMGSKKCVVTFEEVATGVAAPI